MHYSDPYRTYLLECQTGTPAEIILGSPASPECEDLGVCRILLEDHTAGTVCHCGDRVSGYLRNDRPSGRLLLHILSCTVTPRIHRRHFAGGYFRVMYPYRLEADLCRLIGLDPDNRYVFPGRYPVLDDEALLTVSLRVGQTAVRELPRQLHLAA